MQAIEIGGAAHAVGLEGHLESREQTLVSVSVWDGCLKRNTVYESPC